MRIAPTVKMTTAAAGKLVLVLEGEGCTKVQTDDTETRLKNEDIENWPAYLRQRANVALSPPFFHPH